MALSPIEAAEQLRRQNVRRAAWPYEHVVPPPDAIPVQKIQAFPVGFSVLAMAYAVPSGFRFFLQGILMDYSGGPFNPGDAFWFVDVNSVAGNDSVQSTQVQGLQAIQVPLGSVANGRAWPFWSPYEFAALDVVRVKVLNSNLETGFFTHGLFGYLVPGWR